VQTALSRKCKKQASGVFTDTDYSVSVRFHIEECVHQSIVLNEVFQHRSRPFCRLGFFKLMLAEGIHFCSRFDVDSGENETGMKAIMLTRTDFMDSNAYRCNALLMHAKHI
jgi:hypothetical protein